MTETTNTEPNLIVIGENVHTTRVLLRKGKRVIMDGEREVVTYTTADGEERMLPIAEAFKETQDYRQGRIKHVQVAVRAAMEGSGAEAEEGMTYLRQLVQKQENAGATFLDVNIDEISWRLEEQKEAIRWLVGAVQEISRLPVSVDSSNMEVIQAGLEVCDTARDRPLLNSASAERLEALDLAVAHNAQVVITAAGAKGMPASAEERLENASKIIEAAQAKGLGLSDIYVDPLFFPISVDKDYGHHSFDAIRLIRQKFGPEIHITGGMSNVSFGIPGRKVINDVFLIMAVEAGADSGIIDPVMSNPKEVFAVDRTSKTYKLAEDVLLGRDEFCATYIRTWRKEGLEPLGPAKG